MSREIWKKVKGYEGLYEVSSKGRVRTIYHFYKNRVTGEVNPVEVNRILKPAMDCNGYLQVLLRDENDKRKFYKVHQIMGEVFLKGYRKGSKNLVVNHINHVRWDNDLKNLEVITKRENALMHQSITLDVLMDEKKTPLWIVENLVKRLHKPYWRMKKVKGFEKELKERLRKNK